MTLATGVHAQSVVLPHRIDVRDRDVLLPWHHAAPPVIIRYDGLSDGPVYRHFRLADGEIDAWHRLPLRPTATGTPVTISSHHPAIQRAQAAARRTLLVSTALGPVLPFGTQCALLTSEHHGTDLVVELSCDALGFGAARDIAQLTSHNGSWAITSMRYDAASGENSTDGHVPTGRLPSGMIACLPPNRHHGNGAAPLRVWERSLTEDADGQTVIPLRFQVVPGIWPQIELRDADGTPHDIRADAHELQCRIRLAGLAAHANLEIGGVSVTLSAEQLRTWGHTVDPRGAELDLAVILQDGWAAVSINGRLLANLLKASHSADRRVDAVTGNTADFTVGRRRDRGLLTMHDGATLLEGRLFGLRNPTTPEYAATAREVGAGGPVFYETDSFAVHDRLVRDAGAAGPDALVPDPTTIVSPVRVVEEFAWRDSGLGDMVRVDVRDDVWRSRVNPGRFPGLETPFTTANATWHLAMETFQRNSSAEFALPGETGLWSAGYFQGPGEGFGVWRRDTSHVALRGGNLLDRAAARASLVHVVDAGFDNGADGDSVPAVAVWDHYLATGDATIIYDTWEPLVEAAVRLEHRLDPTTGLIAAPQSTSNDLFDEPEVGGFALSTEIYSMQTFAALAHMAALPGIEDPRATDWKARATNMRHIIRDRYWNPARGFFTSGPRGSSSFRDGVWETSGVEAAIWGHLGDLPDHTKSVLRVLRTHAMSDYGIVLFPDRPADNHFCGTVWYCWQAGFARAAARTGDAELVHRLIGQQVRAAVRNKTFYEVTDAGTGYSWRWPGQLWHAAGFASLVLCGVFGITYDESGLAFRPAVHPTLTGTRLKGLRYRDCTLDVEIVGHGTTCRMTLDGESTALVPATLVGDHVISLVMS